MAVNIVPIHEQRMRNGRGARGLVKPLHQLVDLLRHRRVGRPLKGIPAICTVLVVLELVGTLVAYTMEDVRQERGRGKELWPALQRLIAWLEFAVNF